MATVRERSSELLHLLHENLQDYKMLLQLAEEAHEELAAGDAESLDARMVRRQEIQREIAVRDGAIKRLREREANASLPGGAEELVEETVQIVAAIQEVDRKTLRFMEGERERLRDGILALRQGKRAAKGYSKSQSHPPRFLDRRS